MKKTIVAVGACLCGTLAGVSQAEPGGARQPVQMSQGEPWTVNGVTYTVDWTTLPRGHAGEPLPHPEITVHVDNRGKDYAHFPDPAAVYEGDASAIAGWTQPISGAEVAPGHTGDFQSAFPLRQAGGTLQVRVMAYTGDIQEFGYWTGIVHSG